MRKAPTEGQKARAAERRERFRALAKQLASLPDAERAEFALRVGSVVTVEGRALSLVNTMLVVTQCPGASMVGGFGQWLRAGRAVRKGECGIGIWIPVKPGKGSEAAQAVDAPADVEGNDKSGRQRFIMGTVFDVAQTQEIEQPAAV